MSSPTKPKKTRQQATCQGGEEEDDTARDEDFVLQVEAEDGEESEAPSESSSDPEPAMPRSTPRGSTSAVIWMDKKEDGEIVGLLGVSAGCPGGKLWPSNSEGQKR